MIDLTSHPHSNAFDRITDPQKIRETLDGYMNNLDAQSASFIPVIFSREHRPGGIAYEGCRPFGACQTADERTYSLTNSDSNYSLLVASLKLSQIEYLDLLPAKPSW